MLSNKLLEVRLLIFMSYGKPKVRISNMTIPHTVEHGYQDWKPLFVADCYIMKIKGDTFVSACKIYLYTLANRYKILKFTLLLSNQSAVAGAGLVLWVGGPPDASLGFYLREAFQSKTNTEKILYTESRYRN